MRRAQVATPINLRTWVLICGTVMSQVGDKMAALALALYAAAIHSPTFLAAVLFADLVPPLFLGTFAGSAADRKLRPWLWPVALSAQAGAYLCIAVVQVPALRVCFVAAAASAATVMSPVAFKLLREIAGTDSVRAASRIMGSGSGAAGAFGALLAGVLYPMLGIDGLLLVDSGSFLLLAVATVAACRGVEVDTGSEAERRSSHPLAGFQVLADSRSLGLATVFLIGISFCTGSLEGVVGVFFFRDQVHMSAVAYGAIIASWSAGIMCSVFVKMDRAPLSFVRANLGLAGALMGAAMFSVAIFPLVPLAIVAYLLGGLGNGVFLTMNKALIYGLVPTNSLGRAWAAYGILLNTGLIVGYLSGALLGSGDPRLLVLMAGVIPAIVGSLHFARMHLRTAPAAGRDVVREAPLD
jgi:MFS family permease